MLPVESRQFLATAFYLPHLHLVPRLSFADLFGTKKLEFLGYRAALFA